MELNVGEGAAVRSIAVEIVEGRGPTILWLSGFGSDMAGSKATALAEWAATAGRRIVRFDYSGHGKSGGEFEDGSISRWTEEALAVVKAHCDGPLVLVGSSMGGWISLLVAKTLAEAGEGGRIGGLVLIAPAPDFTEALMVPQISAAGMERLMADGRLEIPSLYSSQPMIITRLLIEDGRNNLILGKPLRIGAPVRILQGMADHDVPYAHALKLVEALAGDDVTLTLVKDGDHRLSRPEDIERMLQAVRQMVEDD